MALTDYTFKLGDDGVLLNADTVLPFVDIEEVNGLDSAPFRDTSRDHEGVDGGFMDAEFEKARPIILEGVIFADKDLLEPYLDSLKKNYAPRRELIPFYFKAPGNTEKVLFVKPLGVRYDWTTDRRLGTVRAQFLMHAEDPRIYDNTLQSVDIPLSAVTADGFAFPFGFPLGFGVTNKFSTSVSLENFGNRPTPVEFIVTGPATDPKIVNESIGAELEFFINLSTSDTLTINTHDRTVRLNGTLNRRNTLQVPNWFDLEPGQTSISYHVGFSGTNVFDPVAVNVNPFFETDVSDWTVSGGTFVRSTTKFHEGVASGLLTPDGVTATVNVHTTHVPVQSGRPYKVSVWLNCDVARTVNVQLLWFEGDMSFISVNTVGQALTANTWTLVEGEFVAPALSELAWMQVEMFSTPPISHLLYIDEAKILKPLDSKLTANFRSAWR